MIYVFVVLKSSTFSATRLLALNYRYNILGSHINYSSLFDSIPTCVLRSVEKNWVLLLLKESEMNERISLKLVFNNATSPQTGEDLLVLTSMWAIYTYLS